MKVTYLLSNDGLGGTQRSVVTQVEALLDHCEVEVLLVLKRDAKAFFPVDARIPYRYLIDATDGQRPLRPDASEDPALYRALVETPPALIEASWEGLFNRLTESEIEIALRQIDTDVVVTTTPALMALATQLVPPSVAVIHQDHRTSELRVGSLPPLLEYGPRATAMVFLTEPTLEWFRNSLGASAPILDVIPNAIPGGPRPVSSLDSRTFLMAGRLVREKQPFHVLEAMGKVVAERPDWKLRIVGNGPLEASIRRQVQRMGLHNNVELVRPTQHMEREWAKASAGVLASMVEGMPLVVLEAMAAGVPFVSYDSPNGPSALIEDGVSGLLVALDDTEALAEALLRMTTDERFSMGAAAYEASLEYRPEVVARQWMDLFERATEYQRSDGFSEGVYRAARQAIDPPGAKDDRTASPGVAVRPSSMPRRVVRGVRRLAGLGGASRSEKELLDADPSLRWFRNRIWCRLEGRTPWEAKLDDLDLVTEALGLADVPWALADDRSTATGGSSVMVLEEDRSRVLEALRQHPGDTPVYVSIPGRASWDLARELDPGGPLAEADAVMVNRFYSNQERTLQLGPDHGCLLMFLATDPDLDDHLLMPRATVIGNQLPSSEFDRTAVVQVADRSYRSLEAFTRHGVTDLDFPVDAVYMWVDGSDPEWQAQLKSTSESLGRGTVDTSADSARFRSRDELRYSIRSVRMYAPWIRHIYLVTDRQRPTWLDVEGDGLTVVDHTEIFPDSAALPTFNSHAIGARLHHIPDLSEHYLVVNDDVFFARSVEKSLFFLGNGMAKHFPSSAMIPYGPPSPTDDPHVGAWKNARALVEKEFGRYFSRSFYHTPIPQLRSVSFEMEERFPAEHERTVRSRFRNRDDVEFPAVLHHYYAFLTERSVPGSVRYNYVNLGVNTAELHLTRLLSSRNVDIFCLNDTDGDDRASDAVVEAFMRSYFPIPSPYERPL